ncbi:AAA family ATPase [Fimbriimonas ginsengisoli]|nr:AAA family ATPase [Fimbriimonas ginsengisoli]
MLFRKRGSLLSARLAQFFGVSAQQLPIRARGFSSFDLPNLQLAIQAVTRERGGTPETIGYLKSMTMFSNSFRDLLSTGGYDPAVVGPVQYRQVETGVGEELSCVEEGIFLINLPVGKVAALLRQDQMKGSLQLEVTSTNEGLASDFILWVRDAIARLNVYRGKVLSLEGKQEQGRCTSHEIRFHRLPEVNREQIILPAEVLRVLERNTIGFFKNAQKLLDSGRSVKRGLLLFGKPGTGKTFTARWLAQATPGLTVLVMSGEQLWLIRECCQLARMLAPSLVIMEDVDLIASARDESRHPMYQVTLHQLLNEMDGIEAPAPILFLLTTNRPDAIEPAIASRPGRIDQAIEYPLPDADCRRQLIELYSRGLVLEVRDIDTIVARTEGASPAFIQEMLRKAALFAAEEPSSDMLRVTDEHCQAALRELLFSGGELTRRLLGFSTEG